MKRLVASAALGAVVLISVPVAPASACTPAIPTIYLDRTRVPRGASVQVSGKQFADANGKERTGCSAFLHPTPAPTATAVPVAPSEGPAEPSPSESPLVSLPPLRRVAFVPARPVTVTIEEYRAWPARSADPRTIATVAAGTRARYDAELFTFSFAARVTIPRDVTPGRYVLRAYEQDAVYYGEAQITVTNGLASTGGDSRVAWLAVTLLGAALVVLRRRAA